MSKEVFPNGMKLSVVIPIYNEEKTLREIVEKVQATPYDKEIIVVDDGSTDGTREILAQRDGRDGVRVILHEENGGKGSALATGFKAATGDVVLIQDADLEYDPDDYAILLRPIEEGMLVTLPTREEYERLLASAGLELGRYRDVSVNVARTWDLCLDLVTKPAVWSLAVRKGSDTLAFVKSFRAMQTGFANGAFRYALIAAARS